MATSPRVSVVALAFVLFLAAGGALQSAEPAKKNSNTIVEDQDRPVIGLVLAGGGARGAAHVGVLQVLEELQVPVDFIVGTSMGAIVGGLYAAGMSPDEMQDRFDEIDWIDAFNDRPPRANIPYREKLEDRIPLFDIEFGMGQNGFGAASGFVAGQKLGFLLRTLTLPAIDVESFDELGIPFRAVAADLESGEMVVLDHGDLALAIRASMSFPGMFTPVEIDGRTLVDGGVLRNLPVDVALEMGADIIIAVDVSSPLGEVKKGAAALTVMRRSYSLLSRQTTEVQRELVREQDLLITPDLTGIRTFEGFDQIADAVTRGNEAAQLETARLSELAVPETEFNAYIERQRADESKKEIVIHDVIVRGVSRVSPKLVAKRVHTRPGDVLDLKTLAGDLKRVYLIGEFAQVAFDLDGPSDNRRLVITATEKSWGPWYIRPGAAVEANASGLGRFTALGQLRRPFINRIGGEWRTILTIGDYFAFVSELWQPIEFTGHFFVAPRVDFRRRGAQTVLVGDSVQALDADRALFGFDFGYQIGPIGEVRVGMIRGELEIEPLEIGASEFKAQLGAQRTLVTIDQLDNFYFPSKGTFAEVELLFSREGFGADDEFDSLGISFVQAWNAGKNRWLLHLEGGSDLGSDLPTYKNFALGGFMRLSGYDRNSLLGPTSAFGKLLYYRQVGSMPSLLGGDFYLGASVEAGNVWAATDGTPSPADLQLAGSVWAGVDTILGPLYTGYGYAQGGYSSWYFFLGRIF